MNIPLLILLAGPVIAASIAAPAGVPQGQVLAADPLDGTGRAAWRRPPASFVDAPGGGRVFRAERGTTIDPSVLPWIGDESWSAYRVEVDVLPEKMWAGIDFHVQNDGASGCNVTMFHLPEGELVFELAGLWGEAYAWKPWPIGQRRVPHRAGDWVRLRLDIGPTSMNMYINGAAEPAASFRDLPFSRGGVRLMTYAGSALFRNLKITEIAAREAAPVLTDPWAEARAGQTITSWEATPPRPKGYAEDRLPSEAISGSGPWTKAPADSRGVIHLTPLFRSQNTSGVSFARTRVEADKAGTRRLKVTYTDTFSLWCNGQKIFDGPPRQWFHPDREKNGNSRLIPDQYEVAVPLRAGANEIIVRTEVTEPFGWAFWMRWIEESDKF